MGHAQDVGGVVELVAVVAVVDERLGRREDLDRVVRPVVPGRPAQRVDPLRSGDPFPSRVPVEAHVPLPVEPARPWREVGFLPVARVVVIPEVADLDFASSLRSRRIPDRWSLSGWLRMKRHMEVP